MIMGRYRRILAAVDGSESGRNAFRQACRMAVSNGSWLTAITTVPPYEDLFQIPAVREKVSRALRQEGEKVLAAVREIAKEEDASVRTLIEEAAPFHAIVDTAEEGNYDLIVMGRHGTKPIERALVGSVTARVIGSTQRDILVFPFGTAIGWSSILVATDGSRYGRSATEKAIAIAKAEGSLLSAVSVVDVTEEFQAQAPEAVEKLVEKAKGYVEEVAQRAEAEGVKILSFVREGESYRVITDLSRTCRCEVIVMGSHGRTGVRRLLMGSVTEKVIGYAPCPVLVVRG
jgi:nucleotide-binding universal stress UspA family protein